MAKGYEAHQERLAAVNAFGKILAKRAGFKCEWCDGDDTLRAFDLDAEAEPTDATLALLCANCRNLAEGKKADTAGLRSLSGAVWHAEPKVAEGAARVLARSGEDWARELVSDSGIDEGVKREILG